MMKMGLNVMGVILIAVLGIAGFVYTQKDAFAGRQLQKSLTRLTGGQVRLEGLKLRLDGTLSVDKLMLMNPSGFKEPILSEISNVFMQMDLKGYITAKSVGIKRLTASIDQINLERTEQGVLNLRELPGLGDAFLQAASGGSRFKIERLELLLGKIRLDEYVAGQPVQTSEADLAGRREIYSNLNDPALLIQAPVLHVLSALNRGSLGIRRELIQAKLRGTAVPKAA